MNKPRIYLSTFHPSGCEDKYVFANNFNWINVKGENLQAFENDLQNYLDDDCFVVALNSGTSALHLALILLGVRAGDEVICQSMTFAASANPIIYQGANPVFVDSEPETWNICPIALEKAIVEGISKGKKPKVIITVDLYGMPFKADEIKKISIKYEIPIIEDAAEALGSSYKKKKCGTLGDISIFSFNGNKIITSSGGGALIVRTKELKDKAVFLSTQARDEAPYYQHTHIGYNYRMNNICAGIGRGQMEVLEERISLRREMHKFYMDFFENISNVEVLNEPSQDFFSNHWLSVIVLNSYEKREALRLAFEKENIETRPLWKPMHLQPVFKDFPYYGNLVAENLFNRGLCLPSGSNITSQERNRIFNVLQLFFE